MNNKLNFKENFVTLKVLNKEYASQEMIVAEITVGSGLFKEGYVVIAPADKNYIGSDNKLIYNMPATAIMAIIGSSREEYEAPGV